MKKLYRRGTVHPSPPLVSDQLAFLPATILTLTAALSPEDREVLAYLISSSFGNFSGNRRNNQMTSSGGGKGKEHQPSFNCNCFRCYMSYWVRWDSSPNRQLIHEIIDAFEEGLVLQSKKEKNKKERRKRVSNESKRREMSLGKEEFGESKSMDEIGSGVGESGGSDDGGEVLGGGGGSGGDGNEEGEEWFEKGSVRKFVSFIGERIWNVWT